MSEDSEIRFGDVARLSWDELTYEERRERAERMMELMEFRRDELREKEWTNAKE